MDTPSDGISRRRRQTSKDGFTAHPMPSPRSFLMRTAWWSATPFSRAPMPDELRSPIKHHLVLHRIDPDQGVARFYSL
jgi:hypothetical protein